MVYERPKAGLRRNRSTRGEEQGKSHQIQCTPTSQTRTRTPPFALYTELPHPALPPTWGTVLPPKPVLDALSHGVDDTNQGDTQAEGNDERDTGRDGSEGLAEGTVPVRRQRECVLLGERDLVGQAHGSVRCGEQS